MLPLLVLAMPILQPLSILELPTNVEILIKINYAKRMFKFFFTFSELPQMLQIS